MDIDVRNGCGFVYQGQDESRDWSEELFPDDVSTIMHLTDNNSSNGCLVEAVPGAGKSHLVENMQGRCQRVGMASLTFYAHINGGSRRGTENALYVLDEFAKNDPEDSLLIIDNIDYYGYSRRDVKRRYVVAKEHLAVANYLIDWLNDDQTPDLVATSHDKQWRESHWRYGEKYCDDDVTPVASALLASFDAHHFFKGNVSQENAVALILKEHPTIEPIDAERMIEALENVTGQTAYRHIGHVSIDALMSGGDKLVEEIERVEQRTLELIGTKV